MASGKMLFHGAPVRLLIWAVLAALAVFVFSGAMLRQEQRARERSLLFLASSPEQGRVVFREKGCLRCHSVNGSGGNVGPELSRIGKHGANLTGLITAMWNHAPRMFERMHAEGISYPTLNYDEVAQLLSYLYVSGHAGDLGSSPRGKDVILGDPERGWHAFQSRGCAGCHSIRDTYQLAGPNLGPDQQLPESFSTMGELMLKHSPEMQKAMAQQATQSPALSAQEMNDIFAFLYSLRYVEPSGSPHVGASVFNWRGCSRCHGENAEGTSRAPSLHGRSYNSVALAVALWGHGQQMYAETRRCGLGWPTLTDEDVGDLLAFLNTPRRP